MKFNRLGISLIYLTICLACEPFRQSLEAFNSNTFSSDLPAKNLKPTQTILLTYPSEALFYSQPVNLVANVVPSHLPASIPTGKIEFKVNQVVVSSQALVNGSAKFTTTSIPASSLGQYVTAIYSGDDTYAESGDSLSLSIFPAQTTINLTSSSKLSSWGTPVSFTAIVHAIEPAMAIPDGAIQFKLDGMTVANTPLDANGRAVFSTSDIKAGNHNVMAIYTGNANFNETGINGFHQVKKAQTTTKITSSLNPSTVGQDIHYIASVTSEQVSPTGAIQFKMDGKNVGHPSALDSKGQASINIPNLTGGTHKIDADYLEETNFEASTIFLYQQVNKIDTTVRASSSDNPLLFNKLATFTIQVTAPNGIPTGIVQIAIDGRQMNQPIALDEKGQASLTIEPLTVGNHQITVVYVGNENFNESISHYTIDSVAESKQK